jgi:hypothetical protein
VIEIRNLQFQPLTFQLGSEGSLHLGPRQRKSIARKDLSAEIQTAAKRGLVRITELNTGSAQIQDKSAEPNKAASKESKSSKTKGRK